MMVRIIVRLSNRREMTHEKSSLASCSGVLIAILLCYNRALVGA